jgi:hypothetical protein
MREGVLTAAALMVAMSLLATAEARAQLPPAATVLPKGFTVTNEQKFGSTVMVEATKANEDFPQGHTDHGISFSYSYSPNPMVAQMVEMMASAPEEPASSQGLIHDEPCGKQRYKGGVLTCRKTTSPYVGAGNAPDLVTWNVSWMRAAPGGLVGVSVSHLVGGKETAVGWIDNFVSNMDR